MSLGNHAWILASVLVVNDAASQSTIVDVHQGTNMALTLSPDSKALVVDLVGRLWRLPASGGAAEPLTQPHESARNPRFSPDGRQIVYQRYSEGQWDLWTLDVAARTSRPLTGPPYDEREPDYRSDGSIVFASDRAGSFDVWALEPGSGELTQLTAEPGDASFPSVSDTGDLVYVNRSGGRWMLQILTRNGLTVEVYATGGALRAPSWRPGGGVIVFNEQSAPRESNLRLLVPGETPVLKTLTSGEDVFGFRAPWLSPAEFLYTADGEIWRRGLASTKRHRVPLFAGVAVTRADHRIRWDDFDAPGPHPVKGIRALQRSQDGTQLAFTALGDLWLQDGRSEPRRLTDDEHLEIDPVFTPDGETLIFASDRAGTMDLWQMTLPDRQAARLTSSSRKAYRPAVSPDGRTVAYLETSGFGPWAESSLKLLDLRERKSETVATGLVNAARPGWQDERTVWVQAQTPATDRPIAGPRARLEIDADSGERQWVEPVQPVFEHDGGRAVEQPEIRWRRPSRDDRYMIQVERLFDGVGTGYRRHMDIHVEGGRITAIVARGLKPAPDKIIDARDLTVIPGLIDIHSHQSALAGERLGRIWLAYGVTTVRELGSDADDARERGESWASQRRLGPRLLVSNPLPRPGPAAPPADWGTFDVLELYAAAPSDHTRMLVEHARLAGMPIFSEDLFPAASFGVHGLEHIGSPAARPYDLEISPLQASYQDVLAILHATGIAVAPALAASGGYQRLRSAARVWSRDPAYAALFHEGERRAWRGRDPAEHGLDALGTTVSRLIRSGGRVAVGSDAPMVPYGLGLHAELALLSAAGIPNDQVLRLATAEAALALGLERHLGTVEAGKVADLVVLRGNPLARMADTLSIEAVVREGEWFDRADLLSPQP